jgi:hypothetical protein
MVDAGTRSKTLEATVDSCAQDSQIDAFGHDGLIKRLALPLISFGKVDAQHSGLELLFHGSSLIFLQLDGAMGIFNDVYIGEDNKPLGYHLIDDRQKALQLFLGIDDRKHDRAVM